MAEPAVRRMTIEEFFDWERAQDEKCELVRGIPFQMMTGASRQHDRIVVNLIAELRTRLRGKPCAPFTSDTAVRTGPDSIRRPDAGVDCGPFEPDGQMASEPTLVVEVLSPSTHVFDLFEKTDEYRTVPSIAYILLVEPNEPRVMLRERTADGGWLHHLLEGADEAVDLPGLGIRLPLAELYADVPLRPRPRLLGGFYENGQPIYVVDLSDDIPAPAGE